ncbi:MAG: DnaJ domain-containing protein [Paludibacteraceae bacterium]|nr:DnaJ domain-containing protein [Paludibacteraceae bacterium]
MDKKKLSDKEIIEKYAEVKQSFESLSELWALGLGVSISTGGLFLIVLAVPILIIISIFMLLRYFWKKKMLQANMEISFEQAKSRYEFISDNIDYLPMIKQVCSLNPNARPGQVALIKEWYGVEESIINEFIFDDTLSDENLEFYKKYSKEMTISAKKAFVHKLFKLTIVEDGIHNDEWNLLMKIMEEMDFNHNFINYFIRRYKSLRTESENSSNNESTSTEEKSISLLKPYYDLLGLEVGASDEEIKRAYHNLALQHHPDLPKNADRVKESATMMAKINEAVEKIRN